MPHQGKFTNDCGVFMVCLASLYTKGLISRGWFVKDEEVSDFTSVNITFHTDAMSVGIWLHENICLQL
jgi:hypothetical protein